MVEERPVVLSLGGSILIQDQSDASYLRALVSLLKEIARTRRLGVVVGGGRTARQYIQLGRELGLTEIELDELGIEVTRLHARLLAQLLAPLAPGNPPTTIVEAAASLSTHPMVILGGTEPGHTTDGVAAVLAERVRAERLVNATRTGGIFSADPAKDPAARRIDRLSLGEFRKMVEAGGAGHAGQEFIFDRLGAERLHRARIPLAVVDGRDLTQLRAALLGEPFRGTWVHG